MKIKVLYDPISGLYIITDFDNNTLIINQYVIYDNINALFQNLGRSAESVKKISNQPYKHILKRSELVSEFDLFRAEYEIKMLFPEYFI